jgi:hypothetical protein
LQFAIFGLTAENPQRISRNKPYTNTLGLMLEQVCGLKKNWFENGDFFQNFKLDINRKIECGISKYCRITTQTLNDKQQWNCSQLLSDSRIAKSELNNA